MLRPCRLGSTPVRDGADSLQVSIVMSIKSTIIIRIRSKLQEVTLGTVVQGVDQLLSKPTVDTRVETPAVTRKWAAVCGGTLLLFVTHISNSKRQAPEISRTVLCMFSLATHFPIPEIENLHFQYLSLFLQYPSCHGDTTPQLLFFVPLKFSFAYLMEYLRSFVMNGLDFYLVRWVFTLAMFEGLLQPVERVLSYGMPSCSQELCQLLQKPPKY